MHNREEACKTGGGEPNFIELTGMDERIISLMGPEYVEGDDNCQELGLEV